MDKLTLTIQSSYVARIKRMPQNTVDKLVSLDYEQIESRILAVYSSKPNYMRIPDVITYPKVLKHDEDQEIDKIRKAMNKAFFSG